MRGTNGSLVAGTRERRPVEPSGASLFELGGYGEEDSNSSTIGQSHERFRDHRSAALALLNGDARLTRKAGSFLGQCAVDPTPLSGAQRDWLATLLERAELPPLADGVAQ
jgi:hypothetical protein